MNIAEFIDKAVAWFGSTDAKLEAAVKSQAVSTQLENDLATAKQTIATLTEANKTLSQDNTKLTADLAAANAKLAEVPAQVAAKANEIAAAQGVPPVKVETTASAAQSNEQLWAEYNQLTDPKAKREFYLAHQEQM